MKRKFQIIAGASAASLMVFMAPAQEIPDSEHEYLQLDVSKEALGNAPHFKASEWPDLGDPLSAGGICRAYRVEPYFTTNVTMKAGAMARHARDRDDATRPPVDRGNSAGDVATTARIRQGIMDGKDMSVNAKNVKIVTNRNTKQPAP